MGDFATPEGRREALWEKPSKKDTRQLYGGEEAGVIPNLI